VFVLLICKDLYSDVHGINTVDNTVLTGCFIAITCLFLSTTVISVPATCFTSLKAQLSTKVVLYGCETWSHTLMAEGVEENVWA
jgi:hypothetical protein